MRIYLLPLSCSDVKICRPIKFPYMLNKLFNLINPLVLSIALLAVRKEDKLGESSVFSFNILTVKGRYLSVTRTKMGNCRIIKCASSSVSYPLRKKCR